MNKQYLSRPYLDIKKGTVPASEYKSGKAVALLFCLDYLIHQAEGSAVKILDQMEKYLQIIWLTMAKVLNIYGMNYQYSLRLRATGKRLKKFY